MLAFKLNPFIIVKKLNSNLENSIFVFIFKEMITNIKNVNLEKKLIIANQNQEGSI